MLLILIAFTAYLVKNRRRERFEVTIVVCMLLKYTMVNINHFYFDQENELEKNFFFGTEYAAGSISHWMYAS